MYDKSKMASSTGKNTREFYYKKQVFGDSLTAENAVQLDFFNTII